MPSFKTIFAVATFAFAAFSAAAPAAPVADFALAKRHDDVPAPTPEAPKDLVTILTDTTVALKPLCSKLTAAVDVEVEIDIEVDIVPILDEIKDVLTVAITSVKGLTTVVGKVVKYDVKLVAHLVGELLVLVFTTLATVLKLVGSVKAKLLLPLLGSVCELVATLLGLVLGLVGGLLAFLIPTILSIIPIVLELNVASLLKVLGLGGLLKLY